MDFKKQDNCVICKKKIKGKFLKFTKFSLPIIFFLQITQLSCFLKSIIKIELLAFQLFVLFSFPLSNR